MAQKTTSLCKGSEANPQYKGTRTCSSRLRTSVIASSCRCCTLHMASSFWALLSRAAYWWWGGQAGS